MHAYKHPRNRKVVYSVAAALAAIWLGPVAHAEGGKNGNHGGKPRLQPLPDEYAVPVHNVSCFWGEPLIYGGKAFHAMGNAGANHMNHVDRVASYWMSAFTLKPGERLTFEGEFSHARYNSMQSYGSSNSTDSLVDVNIVPDPGSENPYRQGARRDGPASKRRFHMYVLNEQRPANPPDRAPNTLYAAPPSTDADQNRVELRWRACTPRPDVRR